MRYKSDWEEAKWRLTALWRGERLDRPLHRKILHPKYDCLAIGWW
jgi:hypothetical protein